MQSALREVKCEPSDPREVSGTELGAGTFEETHLRVPLQGPWPLSPFAVSYSMLVSANTIASTSKTHQVRGSPPALSLPQYSLKPLGALALFSFSVPLH